MSDETYHGGQKHPLLGLPVREVVFVRGHEAVRPLPAALAPAEEERARACNVGAIERGGGE